jgi:hypothetical protein
MKGGMSELVGHPFFIGRHEILLDEKPHVLFTSDAAPNEGEENILGGTAQQSQEQENNFIVSAYCATSANILFSPSTNSCW